MKRWRKLIGKLLLANKQCRIQIDSQNSWKDPPKKG